MRIAILGAGAMGLGLGRSWAAVGHQLYLSVSRDPARLESAANELGSQHHYGCAVDAARWCDLALLATPWHVVEPLLTDVSEHLAGKTLVDCTNPLNADHTALVVSGEDSGGEQVARRAPAANVVKAFNTTFGRVVTPGSRWRPAEQTTVPLCGDDPDAKRDVATLITHAGMDPFDMGGLTAARHTEQLALLLIRQWFDQHRMLNVRMAPIAEVMS
jgi:8-hydroxy-5-deazaflavin:NADPH oxidoreductase